MINDRTTVISDRMQRIGNERKCRSVCVKSTGEDRQNCRGKPMYKSQD